MANIQSYLNQIKNAVFGKEVRESIHDAIKQCYDDAAVNHDNANMEVKLARGTHDTLNDRLVENEKNQEKISSKLVTKMNIDDKIKVSQVDKNKGKFDQTYFTDEFLQQMAGNTPVNSTPSDGGVTTEKLANESVTFEKVSDKSALTSLNPYNLFNNSLLKQEVGGWQLNKNASFYD